MGAVAYQQPTLVEEACQKFPGKIASSIDVKGGRVTIPGWAVASNKTALDYAERFREYGIRYTFYSDVDANGQLTEKHFESTRAFCQQAHMRVIVTSDINGLNEIEKLAMLGAPGLEALVVGKSLFQGRIDLGGATAFLSDLNIAQESDTTLTIT